MADVKPFICIRPSREKAAKTAALPYDVYNRQEAKEEVLREPESFLAVDRAETQFGDEVDTYAPEVYQKAHDLLWERIGNGDFITEDKPCYYIYELTADGRTQTGIAACASVDDYVNGVIKKHENTRPEKEEDRIRHIDACDAQTGPIFLAYRSDAAIDEAAERVKQEKPEYDFTSPDGVTHRVWVISDETDISAIRNAFAQIGQIYIADGHHRAASAVKVGLQRRADHPESDGHEEYNYFLSVLFPDSELSIMDYNRVVRDLNGMTAGEFLDRMAETVDVSAIDCGSKMAEESMPVGDVKKVDPAAPGRDGRKPSEKGTFTMYLDGCWYLCRFRPEDITDDPVRGLDVSLLQDLVLAPVLGIEDPRKDPRIDFVGGIRGMDELEMRCGADARVAFAMFPTSIDELFAVADAGLLMPPKSTWFEPKLRSGLFIHSIERERQ